MKDTRLLIVDILCQLHDIREMGKKDKATGEEDDENFVYKNEIIL